MSHIPCAVVGCPDKRSARHVFPNPETDWKRYTKWLDLVGNPKLKSMPPAKVFGSSRVCHRHFSPKDVLSNMRMTSTALPTQNLSAGINKTRIEIQWQQDEIMEFKNHTASVLEKYMAKLYGITNTYDNQPQTLNISDCTKPTSYSNECMISLPPTATILDVAEDDNNGYEHDYSRTGLPDRAASNNDINKLPELTEIKRDFEPYGAVPKKQLEQQKKRGKCRRNGKYSDGTAKFFVAMEKSFRHLPKAIQLRLKGELFESVLKHEKLALEDNHRRRTGRNKTLRGP